MSFPRVDGRVGQSVDGRWARALLLLACAGSLGGCAGGDEASGFRDDRLERDGIRQGAGEAEVTSAADALEAYYKSKQNAGRVSPANTATNGSRAGETRAGDTASKAAGQSDVWSSDVPPRRAIKNPPITMQAPGTPKPPTAAPSASVVANEPPALQPNSLAANTPATMTGVVETTPGKTPSLRVGDQGFISGLEATRAPAVPVATTKPAETAAEKQQRLMSELAETLSANKVESETLGSAVRLAMLEAAISASATPGGAGATIADRNAARSLGARVDQIVQTLSPQDAMVLSAARTTLRELAREGASAGEGKSASEVVRAIEQGAAQAAAAQPLNLPTVVLCTKVDGYGRYAPVSGATMLAGRGMTALVYSEVANFANTPASEATIGATDSATGYHVQLSQALTLYDSHGTAVWSMPAQSVRETSRNARREYFLVQRLELPGTLAPGAYTLKVSVRDVGRNAETEKTLPIRVVANQDAKERGKGLR